MNYRLRRVLVAIAVRLGPSNPILRFYLAGLMRPTKVAMKFNGAVLELRRGEQTIKVQSRQWPFAPEVAANFDAFFATIQAEDGTLDFSAPAIHRYIPSGLEFFMTSLPEELAAIDSYFAMTSPQPGSLVFDIGANCGVTTQRLATMVGPQGRVVAFEPDPVNHAALLDNIRRHNLANVTPVRKGIAPQTGQSVFNSEGTLGAGLASYISRPSVGSTQVIECLSLADAIREFGAPSFIKMDVEGAEMAILSGNSESLKQYRCPFSLDTGHLVDGQDTAERTEAIFRACGYETGTLRMKGGYITTWAVPGR